MANLATEFCGLTFKNPVVVASLETTNSPDLMRQCFDAGASAAIIKTLTDIEDMARLTQNSKYCIMNDRGDVVKGKVQRDFVFYSRSGYSSTYYKDWVPDLIDTQKYAAERGAHLIGSVGAKDIRRLEGHQPHHRGLRAADGGVEFRLSASRDDARRARRLDDRPGARRRLRGDARGVRRGLDTRHGQADAGPVASRRRGAGASALPAPRP